MTPLLAFVHAPGPNIRSHCFHTIGSRSKVENESWMKKRNKKRRRKTKQNETRIKHTPFSFLFFLFFWLQDERGKKMMTANEKSVARGTASTTKALIQNKGEDEQQEARSNELKRVDGRQPTRTRKKEQEKSVQLFFSSLIRSAKQYKRLTRIRPSISNSHSSSVSCFTCKAKQKKKERKNDGTPRCHSPGSPCPRFLCPRSPKCFCFSSVNPPHNLFFFFFTSTH